jgi:hypothetical protein
MIRTGREIKNQYDHMNLSDFEISQLLNLRPKNLDEARVLITRYVHAGKEAGAARLRFCPTVSRDTTSRTSWRN